MPPRRPRFARDGFARVIRRASGGLLMLPWFDAAALRMLTQWYFPLSRGWAAAMAAAGSPDRFAQAIPCGPFARHLLPGILGRVEERKAALATADAAWEAAFFGAGPAHTSIEAARLRAAMALGNLRGALVPLHLRSPLPAVAWHIEAPEQVAQRHGGRLERPDEAFADDFDLAGIEVSRGFLSSLGVEGWLRFPAPTAVAPGPAWARVAAPLLAGSKASPRGPSLVFTHGIAMETEFTGATRHSLAGLLGAGIRVIRPEGPWHGRRRKLGTYGGEPIFAGGPGGLLDYFHAHVIELGRLVAWARATRGGPVCLGGVSLGALTAQLAAVVARDWPAEMRPDALFLVAPSHSLLAVTFEGSLTRELGVPRAIRAGGWSVAEINRWRPLLDPVAEPAVDPARIVVVIGRSDDVTLTAGGEALVEAWKLPAENVFRAPAGHFSTSLGLARDTAPFTRLLQILRPA